MSQAIAFPLAIALALCILYLAFKPRPKPRSSCGQLPPGPPRWPLVGNLLQFPVEYAWLTFDKWSKAYGDVICLQGMGKTIVILNSFEAAVDLLEKRSVIYSSRARMPMVVELMGWDFNFGFMPYGDSWRQHRRAFVEHFNPAVIDRYHPIILRESRVLIKNLLDRPDDFYTHIRLAFTATIMDVVYGLRITSPDDKYMEIAEEALQTVSRAGVPGAFLVDVLPILKYVPAWVPGAHFQVLAAEWREVMRRFVTLPFQSVKDAIDEGRPVRQCVASTMLQSAPEEQEAAIEKIAKDITASAYAAGSDTIASVVQTFFLAMIVHPAAQRAAQAEIDAVVGGARLPDFADRARLPYVNALMKETIRWQLVSPLGIPHYSTEDDVYRGYFIPKGSVVLANGWSMLHDPQIYPEPCAFKPERFLRGGQRDPCVRDPEAGAFGFGRRVCPGREFSDSALYGIVSSVLAAFSIDPPVDAAGKPVQVVPQVSGGLISSPTPFRCRITPRSDAAARLVREAFDEGSQ